MLFSPKEGSRVIRENVEPPQELATRFRQTIGDGERFFFAVAQCRLDQARISREAHFVTNCFATEWPLLASSPKHLVRVRRINHFFL